MPAIQQVKSQGINNPMKFGTLTLLIPTFYMIFDITIITIFFRIGHNQFYTSWCVECLIQR